MREALDLKLSRRVRNQAYENVPNAAYWPEWSVLVDDYLTHSPVRDRPLDVLQLFDRTGGESVISALQ